MGAFFGTLPVTATKAAASWDSLYIFLNILSLVFFVIVVGGMIFFAFKYREQAGKKAKYITDHHALEIAWTIIPTILLMGIFVWGWIVYKEMVTAPPNAYEVRVIGKQWTWNFQYEDGRITNGDLYVPVNQPVKLVMTSEDVLHSFFIPNFRVKQDVVPGMYTTVWFEAKIPGKHQVFCAEYCGTAHSGMLAQVIALEEKDWELWKRGRALTSTPQQVGYGPAATSASTGAQGLSRDSLAGQGAEISKVRGCVACHSDDGSTRIGPTFKGAYGRTEEMSDGSKVTVDDNYIRESLENPAAKVVKGFNPVMPTFKGQITETELNAVIAYLKSLK